MFSLEELNLDWRISAREFLLSLTHTQADWIHFERPETLQRTSERKRDWATTTTATAADDDESTEQGNANGSSNTHTHTHTHRHTCRQTDRLTTGVTYSRIAHFSDLQWNSRLYFACSLARLRSLLFRCLQEERYHRKSYYPEIYIYMCVCVCMYIDIDIYYIILDPPYLDWQIWGKIWNFLEAEWNWFYSIAPWDPTSNLSGHNTCPILATCCRRRRHCCCYLEYQPTRHDTTRGRQTDRRRQTKLARLSLPIPAAGKLKLALDFQASNAATTTSNQANQQQSSLVGLFTLSPWTRIEMNATSQNCEPTVRRSCNVVVAGASFQRQC